MKHKNDSEFNARLNGKQKFALRKLTVGLTTVMLGTTFALTNQSTTAHADEVKDGESQTTEVVKENDSKSVTSSTTQDRKQNAAKPKKEDISKAKNDQSEKNTGSKIKANTKEQILDIAKSQKKDSKPESGQVENKQSLVKSKAPSVDSTSKSKTGQPSSTDTHTTSKVEDENRTVQEVVNYVYGNDPHKGNDVYTYPSSNPANLTYSRSRTHYHNTETGADTYSNWSDWKLTSADKALPTIELPQKVRGLDDNHINKYHVDPDVSHYQETINGQHVTESNPLRVTFDSKKINGKVIDAKTVSNVIPKDGAVIRVVVPYNLSESINVHYIDEDSKKEIGNKFTTRHDGQVHAPESTIDNPVNSEIADLTSKNYVLDTATTNGNKDVTLDHVIMLDGKHKNLDTRYDNFNQTIKVNGKTYHNKLDSKKLTFDNDENPKDQILYVYFTHAKKTVQQQATIREVVKGYYENGPKMIPFSGMGNPNAPVDPADETNDPDVMVTLQFNRQGSLDLVDGTTTWGNWTANNATLPAIPFNNTLIKDHITDNYYLDKNGVVHVAYSNYFGGHYLPVSNQGISSLTFDLNHNTNWLAELARNEANGSPVATINVWVPYRTNTNNDNVYVPSYSDAGSSSNTSTEPSASTSTVPSVSVPNVPQVPDDNLTSSNQSANENNAVSQTKKASSSNSSNDSDLDSKSTTVASPVASHLSNGQMVATPNTTEASSIIVHAPNDFGSSTGDSSLNDTGTDELPQTGNSDASTATALGLGIATVGSILGLAGAKRKMHR